MTLLERLKQIEDEVLPDLLRGPDTQWNTLDVIYHPPHVERCWMQLDDIRLFLHQIHNHPDPAECLAHPHDWPSAMKIVSGRYIHDVGYYDPMSPGLFRWLTRAELAAGTYYEMSDPIAWHRVCPIGRPALTVMIAGPLYDNPSFSVKPAEKQPKLSAAKRRDLLNSFRLFYCPEVRAAEDELSYG